jgi:hypothetical protein
VLVQDRFMVCAKHIICSEINLDDTDVLLGDEAQVEARFCLSGDSAKLEVR